MCDDLYCLHFLCQYDCAVYKGTLTALLNEMQLVTEILPRETLSSTF